MDVALCLKMCEQDVQLLFRNKGKINLHASWGELFFYFWVRGNGKPLLTDNTNVF